MFYGLYIWNFSNPYLRGLFLKGTHSDFIVPIFLKCNLFLQSQGWQRYCRITRWETFRPVRRASGVRALSLLLYFLAGVVSQVLVLKGPTGSGLFSNAVSPFRSGWLSEGLTRGCLSGAGFWQPGGRLSGRSCFRPRHSR